ncbi:uncharacterized protein LOC122320511 [Drosophila ficusphila]|uniref:uncharacterized protein LOC122320511 n=1 Tax=Drosophila ficusphila TaxID=30025 RepID=UPI001C894BA2|nr:uncharacterized protein LOC122320511 [Drosophila ficusphila]
MDVSSEDEEHPTPSQEVAQEPLLDDNAENCRGGQQETTGHCSSQQPVQSGPQVGKPAVVAQKPPNAPGLPPQVGQKRVAPAPPVETEAASKSVKKWRRVARKRGFLMGGFKIPYLNDQPKKLPQPEADSYALTFFEQNFNYSTNQDATEEDFLDTAIVLNEDSEDDRKIIK